MARQPRIPDSLFSSTILTWVTTSMSVTNPNPFSVKMLMGAALGAILLFTGRVSAEAIDAAQVVKNIRDGIPRLEAAELRMKTWECTMTAVKRRKKPVASTIKRHEQSLLVQFDKGIMVRNESELFAVKPASLGRSWALTSYRKHGSTEGVSIPSKDGYFTFYPLLAVDSGSTIVQRLDDPTFTPIRARAVANNRVELDYEYTPHAGKPDGPKTVVSGTFTLAPDLDWLVIRSVTRTTGGPLGQVDCVMERQVVRDGDSIRATTAQDGCEASDARYVQYNRETKYTYKLLPSETVDPAEFTLSYYGIEAPESNVYEDRKPFKWSLWGGIGLGCIVLALIASWFARRQGNRT